MLLSWVLVTAFLVGGLTRKPAERVPSLERDAGDRKNADREPGESLSDLAETFPYDVAARFNEGVVANIDAIDTALTTLLAGNVALLVLTIDKIKELAPREVAWAAALMCVSTSACVVAYVLGFSVRANKRDGLRPRVVIPDLTEQPKEALVAAISNLVSAGEHNLSVRQAKKCLAVLAILLLLTGVIVIAVARARGPMVY
jgi:hypothetical protein